MVQANCLVPDFLIYLVLLDVTEPMFENSSAPSIRELYQSGKNQSASDTIHEMTPEMICIAHGTILSSKVT